MHLLFSTKLNSGIKLAKDIEGEERLLEGYNRDET